MDLTGVPMMISLVTFFPLAGVAILLLTRKEQEETIKRVAMIVSSITFILSLGLLAGGFDLNRAGFQFEEQVVWIPAWNITYHVGVDGISILLVLLTTLIMPIAILSSWTSIHDRLKEYMIFMLLLETAMLGVFVALDLFLFYIFWEFSLVPMYFLVGIWGGARRVYAAIKFFLYTMTGSILMLLAILAIGGQAGTFDLVDLVRDRSWLAGLPEMALFIGFAAAFAIKVPLWPFHSWLPDAHVEAPTAGSVILAGILLKLGTYGFLRFNLALFPEASRQAAPAVAVLAIIGILYGAIVSFPQRDVKKLVAYSSVSHLGFVMLGIFSLTPQGIQGAILQMVNHGLSTGALFLIVGFIYERKHTRELSAFGGLWKIMPIYGTIALIVALSSMGLPGLNGFVGEFTILLGSTASNAFANPGLFTALAAVGIILAAVYILWMFQRMFMGDVSEENKKLLDLNRREVWVMVPLLILIFAIGLFPGPFFDVMSSSVAQVVASVGGLIAGGH